MTPEFGHTITAPRTAIVTGGARRIGAALVRALAADGWTLLVHCHAARDAGDAIAVEVGAKLVVADLADSTAPGTIIAALDGLPPPALLINNASGFEPDGLLDFTMEGWERHMAVNLRAPAALIQAFARVVPAGLNALIVNLLDAKLANPNPDFFSYTVSKMGLAGVTELAARALANRGIRVNGIAPSVTLVSGRQTRDDFDAVHRLNPLRRGVVVDEIVAALRFLIATPTITGQVIALDAGQRFLSLPRDVAMLPAPFRAAIMEIE